MMPRSTDCVGTVPSGWVIPRPGGLLRRLLPVVSCCCVFLASCSNQPSGPERIPVVSLSEHEVTLAVGDSIPLQLLLMLPPGYVPSVTWSSSNPEIASVESPIKGEGLVRGLFPGQAVILVSGEGASDSAMVFVTPTEPPPSVTFLVTNGTCSSGQCSSFEVRGFPGNLPPVPAGNRSLYMGTVSTESACLTVPAADTFWIGETPTVWTSYDSFSLGILYPGEGWPEAKGSTNWFAPARSAGWRVTLPGDTLVTPADVCR